jgi:uncharacterized protein (DUF697 family)
MSERSFSPDEMARLHRLALLSDEEITALANVGIGVVTAGRIRRVIMIVMATVGASTTAWIGVAHLWDWFKAH